MNFNLASTQHRIKKADTGYISRAGRKAKTPGQKFAQGNDKTTAPPTCGGLGCFLEGAGRASNTCAKTVLMQFMHDPCIMPTEKWHGNSGTVHNEYPAGRSWTAQFRIWWHLETAGQKNGVIGAGLGVYWTKAIICLTYEFINACKMIPCHLIQLPMSSMTPSESPLLPLKRQLIVERPYLLWSADANTGLNPILIARLFTKSLHLAQSVHSAYIAKVLLPHESTITKLYSYQFICSCNAWVMDVRP